MPAEQLRAALVALESDDRRAGLTSLLEAWRVVRHPRIADLIDHVSGELVAGAPKITGKTIAARSEAWHAVEQQGDPVDVGRLVAVAWPGSWKNALPILRALVARPDDPRIAIALARAALETRYESRAAEQFYHVLFARLTELRDLRALRLLERGPAHIVDYATRRIASQFTEGPPALSPDLEDVLVALEARYRRQIAAVHDKATGEQAYLAAIAADPDNLGLRAVYGDWLVERGDPRGELIALQLARAEGRTSAAATARERTLIEQHGRQWVGTLDEWFEDAGRRFEGGFFAGGRLRSTTYNQIARMVGDPGWPMIRAIESYGDDEHVLEILDHPESHALRMLHVSHEVTAIRITRGAFRALTELSWVRDGGELAPDDALATCPSLPGLRSLAIRLVDAAPMLAWLAGAPVLERIERLAVSATRHVTELVETLATRAGALRCIELRPRSSDGVGWSVELERSVAPGPFVGVVARYRAGKSREHVSELLDRLLAIPPASVRELTIETTRKLILPADERARLAEAVARFDQLEHVSVPWDAPAPPQPASDRGLELSLSLWGTGLLDPDRLDAVWQLIEQLGERYDSFQLNSRPTLRTLEGLNQVKKWAVNPGTRRLELRRDGHAGSLSLARPALDAFTHLDVALGARSPESFVVWVLQLLELAPFFMGACFLTRGRPSPDTFQIGHSGQRAPVVGWLVVFGGRYVPVLPATEVAALAARPSLEGLFVEQTTHNLVVGVARSPEQVTPERLRALADGLREIIDRQLEVRFGFRFPARARAILGPVARELALTERPAPHTTTLVQFVSPAGIERRLVATLSNTLTTPCLSVGLESHHPDTAGYSALELVERNRAIAGVEQLDEALTEAAATARERASAWFAQQDRVLSS